MGSSGFWVFFFIALQELADDAHVSCDVTKSTVHVEDTTDDSRDIVRLRGPAHPLVAEQAVADAPHVLDERRPVRPGQPPSQPGGVRVQGARSAQGAEAPDLAE